MRLIFFKRVQALAFAGSIGQAALRLLHCVKAERESINPANIKTAALCSEITASCGPVDIRPAITEPAPKATSKAGKAQQNKVLNVENKVSVDTALSLKLSYIMDYFLRL